MEVYQFHYGVATATDADFCRPVEHSMEPSDEDRPVKRPMPHSSVINDAGIYEKGFAESLSKRVEVYAAMVEGESTSAMETEPPASRAVRKRHHTLTNGDLVISNNPIINIIDNASSLYPTVPDCSHLTHESSASQVRV